MEKIFISYLTEIKFETRRITFLKKFLPLRNYGMDFLFSGYNGHNVGKALNAMYNIELIKKNIGML